VNVLKKAKPQPPAEPPKEPETNKEQSEKETGDGEAMQAE
jgi:hypothetical protein